MPKGISKKGGPSKKTKTHAQPDEAFVQSDEASARVVMTFATTSNQPVTRVFVCCDEAIKRYCGIELDALEALLNDEDIMDIEPPSVGTSPVKPHVLAI